VSANPLKAIALKFPDLPGVYCMQNAEGKVIYVGKAKRLKSRVLSYFNKSALAQPKIKVMMEQCDHIDFTLTETENKALILEANLIKQYRPRYNVLLRDDKSYPYLYLSSEQTFPRLDVFRGKPHKKGCFYGPYTSANTVRENLNLLQEMFQLRQCSDSFFKNRSKPCLQFQIKRCTAPCVGKVSQAKYAEQVSMLELFLEGKNNDLMNQLQLAMSKAAECQQYETAAQYRDQIKQLRQLIGHRSTESNELCADVFAIDSKDEVYAITLIFIRHGRLLGQRTFFPRCPQETAINELLADFITQYYHVSKHDLVAIDRLITPHSIPGKEWLQSGLQEKFGKPFKIIDKAQSRYREWSEMALKNAGEQIKQKGQSHKASALTCCQALQQELLLPSPVSRIECFDVSHTFGAATVASAVVFDETGLQKSSYRRYNIKDITPGDDYAAMKQVLMRHYSRLKKTASLLPDLLVVDGGLGQMKQAKLALDELQISDVMLLGVSKGRSRKPGLEQLWVDGNDDPFSLPLSSPAMQVIQLVRDEAHRFAITGHRQQRSKKTLRSLVEDIPGIGAVRRQALLQHFGGYRPLRQATVAQLLKVPGVGNKQAELIYSFFNP
jgi:excinuclease ABC subunit C